MMLNYAEKILTRIENSDYPVYYYLFPLVFAVVARNFLEIIAYEQFELKESLPQFHFTLYYLAITPAMILLLKALIRESVASIAKVMLTFSPVIISCPLFDILFRAFGLRFNLGYLDPSRHGTLWENYSNFFGYHANELGPSLGYQIEVALIIGLFSLYIFIKTRSISRSLAGTVACYTLIFFYCSTLYILNFFFDAPLQPLVMPYYYFLVLVLLTILLWIGNKSLFLTLIKDVQLPRLMYYVILFGWGVLMGISNGAVFLRESVFTLIFIIVGLSLAWIYSVITNNIEDLKIDTVSNPQRPLPKALISIRDYTRVAWVVLAGAITTSLMAGFAFFYIILFFILNYFIYSNPPIKLKRFPIISKLPIAINSLLMIIMGLTFIGRGLDQLPIILYPGFLLGGTLLFNFIDLKDYAGDKAAGIKTLPVLLGLRNAQVFCALVVIATYLGSYLIIHNSTIYAALLFMAALQTYLLVRKNYRDLPVVFVFLLSFLLVGADTLIKPNPKALYTLANTKFKNGEYEQSIQIYSDLLAIDGDHIKGLIQRGSAYGNLNRNKEAIADFTGAIDLDPEFTNAYIGRADRYFNLGRYRDALQDYRTAYDQDSSTYALMKLGESYEQVNDLEAALQAYTESIQRNPSDDRPYGKRGIVSMALKRFENAIADLTVAININPEKESYYNNRANSYRAMGRYDRALDDCQKAIDLGSVEVLSTRGSIYFSMGLFPEAIRDLDRYLGQGSATYHKDIYYLRGLSRLQIEDKEGACADFEEASRLGNRAAREEFARNCN